MSLAARGRVHAVTGHQIDWLSDGWELGASAPDSIAGPAGLSGAPVVWLPALVPGTAASSLRRAGTWSLDGDARRFDAEDWWYRTRVSGEPAADGEQLWLCFDGLATVADVWLNGAPLLSSNGMFAAHELRVDGRWSHDNELVIRFRALDTLLAARQPRPKWRAPMVEHQQLRWFRTTLLGRTPGWSPPAAAVGPWRGVRLERRRGVVIDDVRLAADSDGCLDVACRVASLDGQPLDGVEILLEREGRLYRAPLMPQGKMMAGRLEVPDVERWWPHTHGDAPLYAARVLVPHARGVVQAVLGSVGFRSVTLETAGDDFAVQVNGAPIFCRGACWTPLDVVALDAAPEALDRAFSQVVDAGMNMLRVGGTMVYESDAFLDRCDERGVLLWQDFMFANMDYPDDDPAFAELVQREAHQQLARLQGRPCLAVLCGNSEGEQQAAMWGASRERWQPALFHERLAAIAAEQCAGVPYWPSSAHGGAFPHQANAGSTSYYGVGAYRRPLDDARRAEVRFASECLAFANVPDALALAQQPGGLGVKVHHPAWKSRTPRDLGAGWDFDDVRDHYVAALFGVDPLALRASDHARYLDLGRVATGEVMAAVISEWRRRRSTARGGLVWFLKDLWPGAGWGVIDASGAPKAAWYYLRRAMAPVAMSLSDEGCNGIGAHIVNDRPTTLDGEFEVALYRGDVRVAHVSRPVEVPPRSAFELNAAALFDDFFDLSYAYRFGPPSHDLIVGTLRGPSGERMAGAFHFVPGFPNGRAADVGLAGEARRRSDGAYDLLVRSARLAQAVCIDAEGFASDDNYFHLAPGDERRLVLRATARSGHDGVPRGTLHALNADASAAITLVP